MWMMTHHIEGPIVTQTQSNGYDIRRHPKRSIDLEFYRASATALRGQAKRDNRALRVASIGAVVMAGAIGFALVVPQATMPALGDRIAAMFSSSSQTR